MYEQLKSYEGNRIVVELVSGRQLAGTVVEVNQQAVRLKTGEIACVIPLCAIQVFWESNQHDLVKESDHQTMTFEGKAAGGGGGHGGGGGGGGGIHGGGGPYGGGYPGGGFNPGYGYPGYPGIGPGLPCSDVYSRACYQTFNQNACSQMFAPAPCSMPFYIQCGQPFVQSCSTPFVMQCSTVFTSY